jgi:hypothetical protein
MEAVALRLPAIRLRRFKRKRPRKPLEKRHYLAIWLWGAAGALNRLFYGL